MLCCFFKLHCIHVNTYLCVSHELPLAVSPDFRTVLCHTASLLLFLPLPFSTLSSFFFLSSCCLWSWLPLRTSCVLALGPLSFWCLFFRSVCVGASRSVCSLICRPHMGDEREQMRAQHTYTDKEGCGSAHLACDCGTFGGSLSFFSRFFCPHSSSHSSFSFFFSDLCPPVLFSSSDFLPCRLLCSVSCFFLCLLSGPFIFSYLLSRASPDC